MKRAHTDGPVPPLPPAPGPVNDSMRRLQIGIAGVLTVLLLVGMAGLIGDRARERAFEDAAADATVKMPGDDTKAGKAPLEELGVQPVSKEENPGTAVKVPQAAPSTATVPDLEPDPELQRARQSAPR
ncbi:MAG: hypothetical protein CVT78_08980 [Alphaproteobacteria bacterium HGW-Alphaproteobacteria-17]|uniref:hypothetical protein n=1 Tax=Sphingopyxis solisilvae TaxID=1886788 RepID=UPI000CC1DA28|nr:hypothetical protein [Sphingopyxis solisilvae]PKP87250.1 MAG: hypothetical protein CVT78_08980 [Alphaproteobacteria bacterium HGW-Alphaproteobacteria-17]